MGACLDVVAGESSVEPAGIEDASDDVLGKVGGPFGGGFCFRVGRSWRVKTPPDPPGFAPHELPEAAEAPKAPGALAAEPVLLGGLEECCLCSAGRELDGRDEF